MKRFQVVYFWRGERHVHLEDFDSRQAAEAVVAAFRADGWRAWSEAV